MKQRKQHHAQKSLKLIRQYFPKVAAVNDATRAAIIEVNGGDAASTAIGEPALCAFARACYRSFKADGVIIGLTTSYIIKDRIAFRYHNTETISREVVSFDRKAGFEIGRYQLSPPCPAQRLGNYEGQKTRPKSKNGQDRRKFRHFTKGVRVLNK